MNLPIRSGAAVPAACAGVSPAMDSGARRPSGRRDACPTIMRFMESLHRHEPLVSWSWTTIASDVVGAWWRGRAKERICGRFGGEHGSCFAGRGFRWV